VNPLLIVLGRRSRPPHEVLIHLALEDVPGLVEPQLHGGQQEVICRLAVIGVHDDRAKHHAL
jgi:hypothetical protein